MDEPGVCYAEWNKSDEKRELPRDFIHMCNIKTKSSKINEQTKQK